LEDLSIDERKILERILKIQVGEVVEWTHLAHGRDQWQVLVSTVMNLHVIYKAENFLTS
jgi:hypothetical protein